MATITDSDIKNIRNILHHYQDKNGFLRAMRYVRGFVGVVSVIQARNAVRDIQLERPWTKPEIQHDYDVWGIHVSLPIDTGYDRKPDDFAMRDPRNRCTH